MIGISSIGVFVAIAVISSVLLNGRISFSKSLQRKSPEALKKKINFIGLGILLFALMGLTTGGNGIFLLDKGLTFHAIIQFVFAAASATMIGFFLEAIRYYTALIDARKPSDGNLSNTQLP